MKQNIFAVAVAALAALAGAGCHPSEANTTVEPQLPRVLVVQPERGPVENTITLPGDIAGYYQSTLYAKVTGYLKSIVVDKGDWVKSSQVLATIEVPELQQRLDRSQANLAIARLTYQRLGNVWKSDARLVARQDVDIAYAKYQEAKAEDDELRALYRYTQITAPFDGMITARFVDPGALIHAGGEPVPGASQGASQSVGAAGPVVSLARLDKLRVYVYVPQAEVGFVHQGLPVVVTAQSRNGIHYVGTVVRFAHALDMATRTMLTEVDLENTNRLLYPGMYAEVTLVLEHHPDALRVPAAAVGGDQTHTVFVVRGGQLQEIPVTTGIADGRHVEILTGLTSNDLVVQNFSNALQTGEHVDYDRVQTAAALKPAT